LECYNFLQIKILKIKISVVIITLNRVKFLKETLTCLARQTFRDFETIVVNGPSIDETEKIAKSFPTKYFKTNKVNVSISRNIGLLNSVGELICSIDDDAIPKKDWLEKIVKYYDTHMNEKIGAMGGVVYDEQGTELQFKYGYIGIWGEVNQISEINKNFNNPKGYYFNTIIGVNSCYNRKALLEIGGFDEEIEYQHEESDVCIRLIKAGYKVVGVPDAIVYHKFAPSSIRDSNKNFTNWNKIAKNSIYFAIKNSKDYAPLYLRVTKPLTLQLDKFRKIQNLKLGLFTTLKKQLILAYWMFKGYFRGLFGKRKLLKKDN